MKPTVAIVGVGLIGGSLGQALRRSKKYRVLGIGRHARTLKLARLLGAVDDTSTDIQTAQAADIIVLCTPVHRIIPMVKLLSALRTGAVITDVGSVKQSIVAHASRLHRRFVGAHPLAGSHKTGVENASPDLFQHATCVVMGQDKASVNRVEAMWRAAGARPIVMTAADHDRAVALISHLPHVIAHALVQLIAGHKRRKQLMPLLAGSFRDVTRVASSDADQWTEILQANAPEVRKAVREFIGVLKRLDAKLPRPALRPLLKRSQNFRRPLFNGV